MKLRILFFLAAAALAAFPQLARAAEADVALVLALDVSLSVDESEYRLQRDGIAEAFESPALEAAVAGGAHRAIEVLVLEWSEPDQQTVTVDWTRISDAASARAFAAKLRATGRSATGRTAIGSALLAAAAAFERLPEKATRLVIDVSGDGMANVGPPPSEVRDMLVAKGITINGLVILNDEPWVDQYYDMNVVGGAGAFLMQVEDYRSFAGAIRQKLISELVALPQRPAAPPT
ncbi:MAG TPA: DUF1194 domain-containing protein [Stellaceae bacterium]|nr:DUF1194 domain-containing protein [Stellaceae bacterium]